MRSVIREGSGMRVPLFEGAIPYSSLLKGLDEKELANLITAKEEFGLYPGFKVGDIERPNNCAGKWE